ncbi:hypothetical protein [Streptomyces sp. NPDC096323]|uniref:hypothetical protein n=1 Tax=Streptomyces sp. NPDC096323 TaxID=3155822 RepID=UPI00331DD1E7
MNTRVAEGSREADKRVRRLTLQFGGVPRETIAARTELAELTGASGDERGAAELYSRIGADCERWLGRHDRRAIMVRSIEGPGEE